MSAKDWGSFSSLAIGSGITWMVGKVLTLPWWGYVLLALGIAVVILAMWEALKTRTPSESTDEQAMRAAPSEDMPSIEMVLASLSDLAGPNPATDRQRAAVERLGMGAPPTDISFEQAGAILSAMNYSRGCFIVSIGH